MNITQWILPNEYYPMNIDLSSSIAFFAYNV